MIQCAKIEEINSKIIVYYLTKFLREVILEKRSIKLIQYLSVEQVLFSAEVGEYTTYGISVLDDREDEIVFISDVSLDESKVQNLCKQCTYGGLSVNQLCDVIEDLI